VRERISLAEDSLALPSSRTETLIEERTNVVHMSREERMEISELIFEDWVSGCAGFLLRARPYRLVQNRL
jgi:hypothetical protein